MPNRMRGAALGRNATRAFRGCVPGVLPEVAAA
jgi:hypothetical protein